MNKTEAIIEALGYIDVAFDNYNMDDRIHEMEGKKNGDKIVDEVYDILKTLRKRRQQLEKSLNREVMDDDK